MISRPGAIGVVIGFPTQVRTWIDYLDCLLGLGLFSVLLYLCLVLGPLRTRLWNVNLVMVQRSTRTLYVLGLMIICGFLVLGAKSLYN